MGNWTIVIHGTGCHHNAKHYDAEQLAAKFVAELKAQGHSIEGAALTFGGSLDLTNPNALLAIED